jgi:phenylalanyl-tRNA synthetase beta chain
LRPGALLIDGHQRAETEPAIRGVESAGMVLSEKEMGISEDHEGILVLPPDAKVGRPLVEQLGDVVFDISTWAKRADLLGVLGFAREVSALTGAVLREPDRIHSEGVHGVEDFVSVAIEDADLCRRFTASVIENVNRYRRRLAAGAAAAARHAADQQRRRHHELRHARNRAAAPRVRL